MFTLHISCSYTIWLFFTWHTWHEILTLLVTRCICCLPPSPHCLVISLVKVFQVTVQLLKSNLWTFTSLSYILPGIGFVAKLDKWKKTEAWIDRWFTFELNIGVQFKSKSSSQKVFLFSSYAVFYNYSNCFACVLSQF